MKKYWYVSWDERAEQVCLYHIFFNRVFLFVCSLLLLFFTNAIFLALSCFLKKQNKTKILGLRESIYLGKGNVWNM